MTEGQTIRPPDRRVRPVSEEREAFVGALVAYKEAVERRTRFEEQHGGCTADGEWGDLWHAEKLAMKNVFRTARGLRPERPAHT